MDLSAYIREVPDHPEPGILFKDITPLLANVAAFNAAVDWFAAETEAVGADAIVALDARGFLFGAPAAFKLGCPLFIVRKAGKLPPPVTATRYELEYGDATSLAIRSDGDSVAAFSGKRLAIVDDLLATGGTFHAAAELVTRLGGIVAAHISLIELSFLDGRSRLLSQNPDCKVISNIVY